MRIGHPWYTQAATDFACGNRLVIATPAEDPNQVNEPPNPTAKARIPQSYSPWSMANLVKGMLSNTELMKPRFNVVSGDAVGNSSTGINEAVVTKASRKILLLVA